MKYTILYFIGSAVLAVAIFALLIPIVAWGWSGRIPDWYIVIDVIMPAVTASLGVYKGAQKDYR